MNDNNLQFNIKFRIGIIGLNDVGKTTLINLLTNYLYINSNKDLNIEILREENFKITDYPNLSKLIQNNIITIPNIRYFKRDFNTNKKEYDVKYNYDIIRLSKDSINTAIEFDLIIFIIDITKPLNDQLNILDNLKIKYHFIFLLNKFDINYDNYKEFINNSNSKKKQEINNLIKNIKTEIYQYFKDNLNLIKGFIETSLLFDLIHFYLNDNKNIKNKKEIKILSQSTKYLEKINLEKIDLSELKFNLKIKVQMSGFNSLINQINFFFNEINHKNILSDRIINKLGNIPQLDLNNLDFFKLNMDYLNNLNNTTYSLYEVNNDKIIDDFLINNINYVINENDEKIPTIINYYLSKNKYFKSRKLGNFVENYNKAIFLPDESSSPPNLSNNSINFLENVKNNINLNIIKNFKDIFNDQDISEYNEDTKIYKNKQNKSTNIENDIFINNNLNNKLSNDNSTDSFSSLKSVDNNYFSDNTSNEKTSEKKQEYPHKKYIEEFFENLKNIKKNISNDELNKKVNNLLTSKEFFISYEVKLIINNYKHFINNDILIKFLKKYLINKQYYIRYTKTIFNYNYCIPLVYFLLEDNFDKDFNIKLELLNIGTIVILKKTHDLDLFYKYHQNYK